MSVLKRAWELRSVTDFIGLPDMGTIPVDVPAGYGVPGSGGWLSGMRWQPFGVPTATVDDAMQLSAVFGCLRLISEGIATMPIDTFTKRKGAGVEIDPPKYLTFDPPHTSRTTYLSKVVLSLLTDGNAFVATPRDDMGVPVALFVLDPGLVEVFTVKGTSFFKIDGQTFTAMDIMHIPGMTLPGQVRGVSPIRAARAVIDGARKAEDYGSAFSANHAMPPGVIEMPDDPGGTGARDRARAVAQVWQETHGGTSNAGKVGVLMGGAQLKTIAVSPEDAQWLDGKRFGVSEIARFYGVPPHLIADASNSTSWGSGLAEQNQAFGQYTLRPWVTRIEESHDRLLTSHGMKKAFVKLNMDTLLRPSTKDRYEGHQIGLTAEFLTINEVRELEDLPPVPWGDVPRPSQVRETIAVAPQNDPTQVTDPSLGGTP